MISLKQLFISLTLVALAVGCKPRQANVMHEDSGLSHAEQTLDSLYTYYSVEGTCLLREEYPSVVRVGAVSGKLPQEREQDTRLFAYLWPYAGTFSAVNALVEATGEERYKDLLRRKVIPGLKEYFDDRRIPSGYASYIHSLPNPPRFYDDNLWVGINYIDAFSLTHEQAYLQQAELTWNFMKSGMDNKLGGGVYWCENDRKSKNTCSNAPGAVLSLKLFKATQDTAYLAMGKALYEWTQAHLQDSTDHLYFDHISMDGKINKSKYAYNSGQMMQAASLLYQATGEVRYLREAQAIARSCYDYFFVKYAPEGEEPFRLLKKGDIWFAAVMLRGFAELYRVDKERKYIDAFGHSLEYAWKHARDRNGLFGTDLSGRTYEGRKWILTQAAMVEMYARLSIFDKSK